MRRFPLLSLGLAAVLALGACGGSSGSSASKTTTPSTGTQNGQPASVTYAPAGPNPSISAKMICESEVKGEIADALQIHETRITTPTWKDHVYSCTYVYPHGSIVLSVKELVDAKATTDYFNGLATKYGKRQNINGLAQGAFIATNDDVVVRKDYKVLLVDVQGITSTFIPAMSRTDVAENIASVIMSCWTGA